MQKNEPDIPRQSAPVTLRTVANHVGLAPCSVSAVLNNSPAAHGIPQHTRDRILRAAKQLNYSPNLAARGLRTKRTQMAAVMAPDVGNARMARIVAGTERFLREKGYLLMITSSRGEYLQSTQLLQRGIEGVITIDATPPRTMSLPLVFIDLSLSDFSDPITHLTQERLTALGETAAQSLLAQIEQKTTHLTRVALAPEPKVGFLPAGSGITVHAIPATGAFAD
jgi:DNA-binding LacI/PurR family transcriptional regulator